MDNGHGSVVQSSQVPLYLTEILNIVKLVKVLLMVASELLSTHNTTIIQKISSHALIPTRTVTCIYVGSTDAPIASCHSMHMHLPLLSKISASLPKIKTIFMAIIFLSPQICIQGMHI